MAEGGGCYLIQAKPEREREPSPEARLAGNGSSERCSNLPKVTQQGSAEQVPIDLLCPGRPVLPSMHLS